jgi:8-oxo-dGTP pyrophosphatase MutT (NUDIX family)
MTIDQKEDSISATYGTTMMMPGNFRRPHRVKKKKRVKLPEIVVSKCSIPPPKSIISYGLILFWYDENEHDIYYLIVQRRDTFEYVDFIRGKYYNVNGDVNGDVYKMVSNMATFERELLMTYPHDRLVDDLCAFNKTKPPRRWYDSPFCDRDSIARVLPLREEAFKEPEYEFPKGRKNKDESSLHCAIREFREETKLSIEFFLANIDDIVETYKGTDNRWYSTHFYVARCMVKKPIPEKTQVQKGVRTLSVSNEVSDVFWCNCKDTVSMLCARRHMMLRNLDTFLKKNINKIIFEKIDKIEK